MKFKVFLKDPDGFYESIEEAATDYVNEHFPAADQNEQEILIDSRRDKIKDFISKWVQYGENVQIEFDTEAGTATVVAIQ